MARPLFGHKTKQKCHQKPNPSSETVPLIYLSCFLAARKERLTEHQNERVAQRAGQAEERGQAGQGGAARRVAQPVQALHQAAHHPHIFHQLGRALLNK